MNVNKKGSNDFKYFLETETIFKLKSYKSYSFKCYKLNKIIKFLFTFSFQNFLKTLENDSTF